VPHLEWRLRMRRIARRLPAQIYRNATECFYDTETGYDIAVAESVYRGTLRELMVAYDRVGERVDLVTIHPLRPGQKEARIRGGRWRRR